MALDDERANIYDEKWKIPKDEGLFVTVELKSAVAFANRKAHEENEAGGLDQVQTVNAQERYVVGVFSRDLSAYLRKEEVAMAMSSDYAQRVMEDNSFRVSRVLPALDLSNLEASAMLRRFDVEVVVLAWYEKRSAVRYYDTFKVKANTEQMSREFTQPRRVLFPPA